MVSWKLIVGSILFACSLPANHLIGAGDALAYSEPYSLQSGGKGDFAVQAGALQAGPIRSEADKTSTKVEAPAAHLKMSPLISEAFAGDDNALALFKPLEGIGNPAPRAPHLSLIHI